MENLLTVKLNTLDTVDSKIVLKNSLALMLAVRCGSQDAARQLLARFYHGMEEQQLRVTMLRIIYLLSMRERDWLKCLCD